MPQGLCLMFETFLYKALPDCEISLDVHYRDRSGHKLPVLLWFHGGELFHGSRKTIPSYLMRGVENEDYCLVSADYRLAPQATIEDIVGDALDALHFVRHALKSRLSRESTLLEHDISVGGISGGGYIALLLAMRDAKITRCLAIDPIINPNSANLTIHTSERLGTYADFEALLQIDSPVVSSSEPDSLRVSMSTYILGSGMYSELLALRKSQKDVAYKYIVSEELQHLAKDSRLCPILVIHGKTDSVIAIEASRELATVMEKHKYEFKLVESNRSGLSHDEYTKDELRILHEFLQDKHRHLQYGADVPDRAASSSTFPEFTASSMYSDGHSRSPSIDSSSTESESTTGSSDEDDDAEQQWAAQVHELTLILNLIFLPLAGKYFGRQFAFWSWSKYMTWKHSYQVVRDKGLQRLSSVVLAGIS